MSRHNFLALSDFDLPTWRQVLRRAAELKRSRGADAHRVLRGKQVALIFEKASTRTRVSFEVGLRELGAEVVVLSAEGSQIARGESLEDTARVLSRYVHGAVLRTHGHDRLQAFAGAASVPVINGLSDEGHPLQVATDLFTILERRAAFDLADPLAALRGLKIAFVGDGACNMALSWIEASSLFGFELRIGAPVGYQPDAAWIARGGAQLQVMADARAAVAGADVVNTDVWISMGMEEQAQARRQVFTEYRVSAELMRHAAAEALVLHCLPAHRGEEIDEEVLEGAQSAVWDQAENRLHLQKSLVWQLMVASEG